MSTLQIPGNYAAILDVKRTENAIKLIKDHFHTNLSVGPVRFWVTISYTATEVAACYLPVCHSPIRDPLREHGYATSGTNIF